MNSINPCQLNAVIAALTNQLYCSLSREEFIGLGIFLSMLSKDMLSMAAIEQFLKWEHRDERAERLRGEARERAEEEKRKAEQRRAEQQSKQKPEKEEGQGKQDQPAPIE